jgi:hypothetical protein
MGTWSSWFESVLRGRFSPYLLVLAAVVMGGYVRCASGVAWHTPVSGQQPAIQLSLHRDLTRLVLEAEDDGEQIHFAIADSLAGVKAFWLEQHPASDAAQAPLLWSRCQELQGAAALPVQKDPKQAAVPPRCALDREQRPWNEQPRPSTYEKLLPKLKSRKVVLWLDAASTPSMYRELWLIPYVERNVTKDGKILNPVPSLHWKTIEWHLDTGAQGSGSATAKNCSGPDGEFQGSCLFVQNLLDRPELVLLRDPQQMAVAAAQGMALRVVPFLVGVMVCANLILASVLVGIIVWWALGWRDRRPRFARIEHKVFDDSVPRDAAQDEKARRTGKIPLLIPLDSVDRGFRRMLEWLEVTGPALGFLLTVCALLLAFDPRVFAERDMSLFASAVSMAMSATFAGLGIRILAFTCDRLLEHVLRRGGVNFRVDLTDNVYEVPEKPVVTSLQPPSQQQADPSPGKPERAVP